MAARTDLTANEIERQLRAAVDAIVPKLFGSAAKLDGPYWTLGNAHGDPGTQMKINREVRPGLWCDFSAPEGADDYSGDMLKLIAARLYGGWSMPDAKKSAIAWAKWALGLDDVAPDQAREIKRQTAERAKAIDEEAEAAKQGRRKSAWSMYNGATPIAGTPAETYLAGRGIAPALLGKYPGALRYLPNCADKIRGGKHPAMIAAIMGLEGKLLGVHRTYLDVSAGKGGSVPVVKLPPDPKGRRKSHKLSLGDYKGGCIPLWKGSSPATLREIPRGTPVYVSEGIEDGLTIALAFPDRRVVAGVALANMGGLILPPQAGPLIFIGQRDPIGGKALEAFERAVARQQEQAAAQGRPMPQIIWPEEGYKDFNDQLRGIRMAEAA
jgi:hypothetical protein